MDARAEAETVPPSSTDPNDCHNSQLTAPSIVREASSRNTTPSITSGLQSHIACKAICQSPPAENDPMTPASDMLPPPAKRRRVHNYDRRPRLSICPSVSPDPDLVEDRDRNDNTLKGKFEAIFAKYGRDFSEIGDEINVVTGEVVVDRGHILSMANEKDPGSPSRARPRVSRDLTGLQSADPIARGARSLTIGALDVIASIEAMARRAVTGQTPCGVDQEEAENVYECEEAPPYRSGSVSSDSLLGSVRGDFQDYQDDWAGEMSGSPDSLLGHDEAQFSMESFYDEHAVLPPVSLNNTGSKDESIVLTSGPVSASAANVELLTATRMSSRASASPKPLSPPTFVKSNGKKKLILNKLNVSKAYEELQRQESSTPATTTSQSVTSAAAKSGAKITAPPARIQMATRKVHQSGILQKSVPNPTATHDVNPGLKRLPLHGSPSEPLGMDYESDDPLQ